MLLEGINPSVPHIFRGHALLCLHCTYEDCGAPMLVSEEEIPRQQGAYMYDRPICRRGIRIGVVGRFVPISPPGGARGGKAEVTG